MFRVLAPRTCVCIDRPQRFFCDSHCVGAIRVKTKAYSNEKRSFNPSQRGIAGSAGRCLGLWPVSGKGGWIPGNGYYMIGGDFIFAEGAKAMHATSSCERRSHDIKLVDSD